MSYSPALAHRQRVLASLAAGTAAATTGAPAMPTEGPAASEYQLLLAALGIDLNELRSIESVERKIEAKRSMIERYRPWVEGALSGEQAAQDEIVTTMLVWAIDVADWPYALAIAAHVLQHGLALPERYVRKPATLIAEEFAEAGLKAPPQIDLETLKKVAALVAGADMHDQVRAKLEKALGLGFMARAEAFDPTAESAVAGGKGALLEAALGHFNTALGLNKAVGVKKLIETLTRDLGKLAPAEPKGPAT
ncbi:phage terminase small subunit [Novosphingobium sp.]|uniref:phage terminase small subunit n=1 Tax=Novosphingobium sp. TaxID=1874826 RepID=UPI00261DF581|nr:phage terminase small subunit [Novosphingobium sp.]